MTILPPLAPEPLPAIDTRPSCPSSCDRLKDVVGCVISFSAGLASFAVTFVGNKYAILVLPSIMALLSGLAAAWLVRPRWLWIPAIGIGLSTLFLLAFGISVFFLGYGTQNESGLPWRCLDLVTVWLLGLGLPVLLVTGFLSGVAFKLIRGGYFSAARPSRRVKPPAHHP